MRNNENRTPRAVTKYLPIILSGTDRVGTEYDVESAEALFCNLQDNNIFNKLSIYVTMARSICFDDETAKGAINVARIRSIDKNNMEMAIVFFGKNVEFADLVDDMIITPRVRTERDSNKVSTFLGFEIVAGPCGEEHTCE